MSAVSEKNMSEAAEKNSDASALLQADKWHHWHGFTQMQSYEPMLIERAEGCWLYDSQGNRWLDGVSSLWCNLHGHNHPRINAAVIEQLQKVAHVTNIGMGCTTTAKLALRLSEICPGDLNHVFFSSDGASAVEVAIKMALQYWAQCGQSNSVSQAQLLQKTKYLALGSAYHGDTVGTVSVGDIARFHQLFHPLLFKPLRGPCPDSYRFPSGLVTDDLKDHYVEQFRAVFEQHHHELAALVIEPLVQGAAGLIRHPDGLLRELRQLCDQYQVLLIADEVATGFGRTGRWFACDHEQVVPDILCLGKGLTGGYLPMAATVASDRIFNAFLGEPSESRQFFHGHTYSGNPLAAAAALASIDLFESERLFETLPDKIAYLAGKLRPLRTHPHVGDVRQLGMMVGIELVEHAKKKSSFSADRGIGKEVCRRTTEQGVWLRPLGDVVVLMPPLCIEIAEIDLLVDTLQRVLEQMFTFRYHETSGRWH